MIWKEERCIITFTTLIVFNIVCISGRSAKAKELFSILLWTKQGLDLPLPTKFGQEPFIKNKCEFQNCFIINNDTLNLFAKRVDAILFNSVELQNKLLLPSPSQRTVKQKYVFVSSESSAKFPMTAKYNNFFNWTWTYKLNSDIQLSSIVIRDKSGSLIGPKEVMHWIPVEEMKPPSDHIISKLLNKRNAVAWFVTNCNALKVHQNYINILRSELAQYNHSVDILALCGENDEYTLPCSKNSPQECYDLIQSSYCFHLSFEDAMSEDYVTDQLLIALNNFAVPVVFGGANYTRFMPDGIYLDALELGPEELATQMYKIMSNYSIYYDMFKWHEHYSYHKPDASPETNGICSICDLLNNNKKRKEITVYTNIVKWFNERKDWNIKPTPANQFEVTRWVLRG